MNGEIHQCLSATVQLFRKRVFEDQTLNHRCPVICGAPVIPACTFSGTALHVASPYNYCSDFSTLPAIFSKSTGRINELTFHSNQCSQYRGPNYTSEGQVNSFAPLTRQLKQGLCSELHQVKQLPGEWKWLQGILIVSLSKMEYQCRISIPGP